MCVRKVKTYLMMYLSETVVIYVVTLLGLICLPSYSQGSQNFLDSFGESSGGFMAAQYHVVFSSTLVGAAIVAGGPYLCALGEISVALSSCMSQPELIDLEVLQSAAVLCSEVGNCDNIGYLKESRVWVYSGLSDTVVVQGVVKKTEEFYRPFLNNLTASVKGVYNINSEHCYPTMNWGDDCTHLGSPYINKCQFDASFDMTSWVLNKKLNQAGIFNKSNLFTLGQGHYIPRGVVSPNLISLGSEAYVYIPESCQNGEECSLVILFHGCYQTIEDISTQFIIHNGMNEVAETNNLIVVYPQVIKSPVYPYNPEGCWDFWGYSSEVYGTKYGPQMITINNMVDDIKSGNAPFSPY